MTPDLAARPCLLCGDPGRGSIGPAGWQPDVCARCYLAAQQLACWRARGTVPDGPRPLLGAPEIDLFVRSGDIDALGAVLRERQRQDDRWGEQNHLPATWLPILVEEVGELAQTVNHMTFGPAEQQAVSVAAYDAELTQVAAVALAMLACRVRGVGPAPRSAAEAVSSYERSDP